MKRLLVIFSGDCYYETTKRTVETAKDFGVDRVLVYDDWWLYNCRPDYVAQNRALFDLPTGPCSYGDLPHAAVVNYCSFKPLIVLDALERFCDPGDTVFYLDADCYPIANLIPLYGICARDGGIMLFGTGVYTQNQWCKRECFVAMGQDSPRYYDAEAGAATYALFQKPAVSTCSRPMMLLWEWYAYSHNLVATTFKTNNSALSLPECTGFREHRGEQAILANLAHKYGFKLYPMAEHPCEFYPQVVQQVFGKTYEPVHGDNHGSMFRNIQD